MLGRHRGGLGILIIGLGLLTARPAVGQVRTVEVSADNDGFAFWIPRVTDWYYTNGALFQLTGDWNPSGIAGLGIRGHPCGARSSADTCVVTIVGLGQKIFTPESLFFYHPGVVDRPYAGWLYATYGRERLARRRTTRVSVQVGVTGNPSLARQVQEAFHHMLGMTEPQGWQYQIPFEPDFAATWRETWHLPVGQPGRELSFEVEPDWAATAGTERTSAQAGLFFRLGWRAPVGSATRGPSRREFHLVARLGSEGEWVVRDLFLDGATWRSSQRTTKEPFVGRTRARLDVGWDRVDIVLSATRSTREFRAQDLPHLYGTVSVRVRRSG